MAPRLLLINPNITIAVTTALAARARELAPPDGEVIERTARFGAPYISDELAVAVAAHALLDVLSGTLAGVQAEAPPPHAVLVGCFGDPGLLAARQVSPVPVHGLAEAAMHEAAARGPFAIVTGGRAWPPMLERLASAIGLREALVQCTAVAPTGGELAADPALARRVLLAECRAVLRADAGVKSIVIGGAALLGVAADLQPELPVPLIDSVDSGIRSAWASAARVPAASAPAWPDWWHMSCEQMSSNAPTQTSRREP